MNENKNRPTAPASLPSDAAHPEGMDAEPIFSNHPVEYDYYVHLDGDYDPDCTRLCCDWTDHETDCGCPRCNPDSPWQRGYGWTHQVAPAVHPQPDGRSYAEVRDELDLDDQELGACLIATLLLKKSSEYTKIAVELSASTQITALSSYLELAGRSPGGLRQLPARLIETQAELVIASEWMAIWRWMCAGDRKGAPGCRDTGLLDLTHCLEEDLLLTGLTALAVLSAKPRALIDWLSRWGWEYAEMLGEESDAEDEYF
jgi:hypothetical protein